MRDTLRLCLVQMTSAKRAEDNIPVLEAAVAHAVAEGCAMVALPETAGLMNRHGDEARADARPPGDALWSAACRRLAARHRLWIHCGSTAVLGPDGKFLNRSLLVDDTGADVATYDKIHLFDAAPDGRPTGESDWYAAGDRAVLAQTPWGPMGLSICYDLRFPQLYRALGQAGARVLFVPSAFMVPTGAAHWEVLLRARAIENAAFVVAAAQVGRHEDGRRTWGHAMVVAPWGEVIRDMGGDAPGCAVIDLDLTEAEAARRRIPALDHDRPFAPPRRG
ncbi:carbon-nitrogen hydrolase family protein [Oceaniglobus roseus]|uniref:carbon-nitrogen hydrolase family protein n=1 Tax=Oceaniglobus roseus TaxID=1737570 RepID=UPI000C7F2573|nr:carbon-nitrogen hydrolase family protein [Kandeliimicrobium roseum]